MRPRKAVEAIERKDMSLLCDEIHSFDTGLRSPTVLLTGCESHNTAWEGWLKHFLNTNENIMSFAYHIKKKRLNCKLKMCSRWNRAESGNSLYWLWGAAWPSHQSLSGPQRIEYERHSGTGRKSKLIADAFFVHILLQAHCTDDGQKLDILRIQQLGTVTIL